MISALLILENILNSVSLTASLKSSLTSNEQTNLHLYILEIMNWFLLDTCGCI